MATYTGFHIECYITVILKKKLLPSPATQEPLLADSAWPCQPPGFSGLMFSFFKSLLLTFHASLFSLPQNPISLYFIKKSISAICLPLVSGSLYPKIHECTQIIKGLYITSLGAKQKRRLRGISEAWGSSVFPAVLGETQYPGHCEDLFMLMWIMPQPFHLLVLN